MVRFRLLKSKRSKTERVLEEGFGEIKGDKGEYSEIVTTKDYQNNQGQMMVSEYGLSAAEKKDREKKITGSYSKELKEKKWEKTAKENLDEIRTLIDKDILQKPQETRVEQKEIIKESPLETKEVAPELIHGDIIDREIVYETSGGYVVKVTYRDNGRIETNYYSVSKIYDVEHALDNIQSYKPIFREKPPEKKERDIKDSFFKKSLGKLRI
jgi:hypothetical protein